MSSSKPEFPLKNGYHTFSTIIKELWKLNKNKHMLLEQYRDQVSDGIDAIKISDDTNIFDDQFFENLKSQTRLSEDKNGVINIELRNEIIMEYYVFTHDQKIKEKILASGTKDNYPDEKSDEDE